MELTAADIEEFREIWKQAFDEELPLPEARQRAMELIELYAQLAKPLPSERMLVPSPDKCATSSIAESPPKQKTVKPSPSNPSGTR